MVEPYTLHRDGQRSLRFVGELRAEARGCRKNGKEHNRFFNIAIYRAESASFVVHWEYVTQWAGEAQHARVASFPTQDGSLAAIEAFDPTEWVEGYKRLITHANDPRTAAGQDLLEDDIVARYRAQVAEICDQLGVVEDLAALRLGSTTDEDC